MKIPDTTLAYLAGIFDGEGYVSIERFARKRTQTVQHALHIGVSNTFMPVLDLFVSNFGCGTIGRMSGTQYACYQWRATGMDALRTLSTLYPFLMIKREQARIGMEFQMSLFNKPNQQAPVTEEDRSRREEMRQALRASRGNGLVRIK